MVSASNFLLCDVYDFAILAEGKSKRHNWVNNNISNKVPFAMKKILAAFASTLLCASPVLAQAASTAPQLNITTDAAMDMAHYAVGLAESRHLKLCIAVEDTDGNLVAFIRMQGAYAGCVEASIAKAKSAARFARNTIEFFDAARTQNLPIGFVPGILPSAGGAVFKQGETVVGSIGTSGDTNEAEQALVVDTAKHFH